MNHVLKVTAQGQGLYDITHKVAAVIDFSGVSEGLVTLFLRHTSASLLIQENADPSAQADLEHWLNRLVPESDPLYTHTTEGPDDMPAHIKAALTCSQVSVPLMEGKLALGTWQGIFLWEHRHEPNTRELIVTVMAMDAAG